MVSGAPPIDETLMSRLEDAGLNASAPPQQRWLDGWLVRYQPGKARRSRCINAVAEGRLPLADRLALAEAVYRDAALPMLFRISRHTRPQSLDEQLAASGWRLVDPTCVMLRSALPRQSGPALPSGLRWVSLDAKAFAQTVGELRGSPPEHRASHAHRLHHCPVPCQGFALQRESDAALLACGQVAQEAELVGLYDIHTHDSARREGLASLLCERLLSHSASQGAKIAYLQVSADNAPARALYRRLGFVDAYGYHYRERAAKPPC